MIDMRFIKSNNTSYVRIDDMIDMLQEMIETEDVDTRHRFSELISSLRGMI